MFSTQQLITVLRTLKINPNTECELRKCFKYIKGRDRKHSECISRTSVEEITSLLCRQLNYISQKSQEHQSKMVNEGNTKIVAKKNASSQLMSNEQKRIQSKISSSHLQQLLAAVMLSLSSSSSSLSSSAFSLCLNSNECRTKRSPKNYFNTTDASTIYKIINTNSILNTITYLRSNNQTQLFFQPQQQQQLQLQQLRQFHTEINQCRFSKQKQTKFAMSSFAAEPLLQQDDITAANGGQNDNNGSNINSDQHNTNPDANGKESNAAAAAASSSTSSSSAAVTGHPCVSTGHANILEFMELIGNLKHTKRTGWVMRDVNDCESISAHMYRMSMMTFLLDGTEGLNQIRCMELALVHDLAESLVGDITPFCGVTRQDKRNMEFKAMEDICKLIEPRGERIMQLFQEYEDAESAESRFVKDLDRLDMIMQAFEYEKRDNCLLKHQEFFDSTAGKFNHPFVKELVQEIYNQRERMATAKKATAPTTATTTTTTSEFVQSVDGKAAETNGHCAATVALEQQQNEKTTR